MKIKLLTIFVLALAGFIFFPHKASAAECSSAGLGDASCTVASSYSFANTVDGLDGGAIQLQSGGTLTILNGYTVAAASFVLNGGSMVINAGATFKPGVYIWMTDSDADGYPVSTTQVAQAGSPGAGYVRKSALASASTTDCYDSNADAKPGQTTFYTTDRGDGSYDYNCDSDIRKRRLGCNAPTCANGCTVPCGNFDASAEETACGTTGIDAGYASATTNNDEYGSCVSCTGVGSTTTTMECR
jgi:hypothetical protein